MTSPKVQPPAPDLEITHEDIDRARDRLAVERAREPYQQRSLLQRLKPLWLLIGPGILVFLGENDAPSMLSYAATGAQFGVGFFLPFVLLTFLAGFVVQEMTLRLGAVTHRGHAELIFERFGPFWGRFAIADLIIGNFLTLVTEFIGVRAGLSFFGVPAELAVGGAVVLVFVVILTHRYWTWERTLLGLAVFNGLFVPAALDKGLQPRDITAGRIDTLLGSLVAASFGIAAILATAPLFAHGINASDYQTAQFAQALEPLIGHVGALLFALGITEAGLLAAMTISASSAYAFGEVLHKPHSLNIPLSEGWGFYAILLGSAAAAAALVLLPNAPLTYIVLIVNVIATLAMPPALLFLVLLVNDREIIGAHANGVWANVAAIAVTVGLVAAGLVWGILTVFPHLLSGH